MGRCEEEVEADNVASKKSAEKRFSFSRLNRTGLWVERHNIVRQPLEVLGRDDPSLLSGCFHPTVEVEVLGLGEGQNGTQFLETESDFGAEGNVELVKLFFGQCHFRTDALGWI